MRTHRASWIASLLLASCTSQPAAPEAPPAHPSGYSTAAAAGPIAAPGTSAQQRASGTPEIRYYVIGDA
jgi:hypothetical protein